VKSQNLRRAQGWPVGYFFYAVSLKDQGKRADV